MIAQHSIDLEILNYLKEDDLFKNDFYSLNIPNGSVQCHLKFKSSLVIICGLPYFVSVFKQLGGEIPKSLLELEGTKIESNKEFIFDLPFNVALNGERIALNLLQRASSIATHTYQFVQKANSHNIKILDTRKTLPGYRSLEKYSVRIGGGLNHRLSQVDSFMIKDNHKNYFGGLKNAFQFFKNQGAFYTPIIAEIHDLTELKVAIELQIKHIMLDNFSPDEIKKAVMLKPEEMTFEISGGITIETIDSYLIQGVDAISLGTLTYGAPPVDISLKYYKK